MIRRKEPTYNTVEKMFDLIWDDLFPHIMLDTNVKLFDTLDDSFAYVNYESKIVIELTNIVTKYKVEESFIDCIDFLDLFDKINFAQVYDWKVYVVNGHLINKEEFLRCIVNDIDRRRHLFRYKKN